MKNISPEEILHLLDNTEQITELSVFRTKMITERAITGRLIIRDRKIKETVTFLNCAFEDLYIDKTEFNGSLEFRNCTFSNDFMILFLKAQDLKLENCRLEKRFLITDCSLRYLSLDRVEAQKGITLEAGRILLSQINPVDEKTYFSLTGAFLFINELYIVSQSGITLTCKKAIINKLSLAGYFNSASRLDFNSIINKCIEINELNNDGKIYLLNIRPAGVKGFAEKERQEYIIAYYDSGEADEIELIYIQKLDRSISANDLLTGSFPVFKFREFVEKNCYDDFLCYEEKPDITFHIQNSSPGILELRSIMFEVYHIEIKNSDLSAIKLIHSKIPDVASDSGFLNYYNVYNDLYNAAVRQSNTKDKMDYYRISQDYLSRYLKHESAKDDIGSRIAITVSRLFSTHGTNWIKASWVTLSIAFIFFILFICSLKEIRINISLKGIFFFFDLLISFYPQFINPIHRIDFMNEISALGGWSALFDFLGRIFVGIGAFEIVRSFRKHVR